jgi:hypothetical protein
MSKPFSKKALPKKRKWKTKKFSEYIYENCMNCGKELRFAIYVEATEFDAKTGKPTEEGWDCVHGEKICSCGAELAVVDDLEGGQMLWLNRDKMVKGES